MLLKTYGWTEERTDRRRDVTRLTAAFCNLFAKGPKNNSFSYIATNMDDVNATLLRMPSVITPF